MDVPVMDEVQFSQAKARLSAIMDDVVHRDLPKAMRRDRGKNEVMYLYAVIALDEGTKTAHAYKLMRRDEDVGPGLRDCPDQRICIDDLAAYVALGEAAIAAGGKPDATYQITATE